METDQNFVENDYLLQILVFSNPKILFDKNSLQILLYIV